MYNFCLSQNITSGVDETTTNKSRKILHFCLDGYVKYILKEYKVNVIIGVAVNLTLNYISLM
jgi:hypothetical protein